MTAHDEAVKAAAEAIGCRDYAETGSCEDCVAAVAAAAPILLVAERKRIAEALRAEAESVREGEPQAGVCCDLCHAQGLEVAARIAEAGP